MEHIEALCVLGIDVQSERRRAYHWTVDTSLLFYMGRTHLEILPLCI